MLECYQREIHAKADQHCWTEDCFADDMEWFAIGVHWQGSRIVLQKASIMCCCIFWTLFNYWLSYSIRQLTFIAETFKLLTKTVQSLICYLWILHTQLHFRLKKWTLEFKLLLSHVIFSHICMICCVNTSIQTVNVLAQVPATIAVIHNFFSN